MRPRPFESLIAPAKLDLPTMSVGDRVCFHSDFGTIRHVGPLVGKKGQWLGIEWDDGQRGKNDGSIDGTRYFTAKSPTGASFLRATAPSLHLGRTFTEALRDKYIEERYDDSKVESVVLGSSDGAIEVEAVNLNKVRSKFAQLSKLKEVGLENYMIGKAGDDIQPVCPNIKRLDLSRNLFSDWNEIVRLSEQLPHLESLTLHYNYFRPLSAPLQGSCRSLVELLLNRTNVDWKQAHLIVCAFPSLRRLELGFNELATLEEPSSTGALPNLDSLVLDGNVLTNWNALIKAIKPLRSLSTLMVSDNQIGAIPLPTSSEVLPKTDTLFLDSNPLSSWNDVDALALWFPNLSNLRLLDVPLFNDPEISKYARLLVIGRLKSLRRFNSSAISEEERKDAEFFYLTWIVRNVERNKRESEHPRWKELVELHGEPEEEAPRVDTTRLQSRLITINVFVLTEVPQMGTSKRPEQKFQQSLQLLPNMPIKTLRLKLLKIFKAKPMTQIRVFVDLVQEGSPTGSWGEIDLAKQADLTWWGVENGGSLGIVLP